MFSMQGDDNGNFFMYSLSDTMTQNMLTKSDKVEWQEKIILEL